MDLYTHLYMVCLLGTMGSGAVTVFLFVKLDIKTASRVLGKKERTRGRNVITKNRKRRPAKSHGIKAGQKTALLPPMDSSFHVIREILLVHTDEII